MYNVGRQQAIARKPMYLSDIDVHADHAIVDRFKDGFVSKFHQQACCVVELIRYLIRKRVVTKDTRKLAFTFTDVIDRPPDTLVELDCKWPFDFSRYASLADPFERKRLIVDALHAALSYAAERLGTSAEPFAEAYREAFRRNLVLGGFSKASWVSPDARHRVRAFFVFDIDGVHLHAVLYKNRSKLELGRIDLGVGVSQTDCLEYYLTNGCWLSDSVFQLSSTDFIRRSWEADFSELISQHRQS
jgi:hypothetical protein